MMIGRARLRIRSSQMPVPNRLMATLASAANGTRGRSSEGNLDFIRRPPVEQVEDFPNPHAVELQHAGQLSLGHKAAALRRGCKLRKTRRYRQCRPARRGIPDDPAYKILIEASLPHALVGPGGQQFKFLQLPTHGLRRDVENIRKK